jgi:phage-related protein
MPDTEKTLPITFYRMLSGREPVREWLKALSSEDKRIIGEDLKTIEYGWPIGMPLCRNMAGGLWEARSNLPNRRTARILFCIADGYIVLLHGFMKKTQQTPDSDLELAQQRMKELNHE